MGFVTEQTYAPDYTDSFPQDKTVLWFADTRPWYYWVDARALDCIEITPNEIPVYITKTSSPRLNSAPDNADSVS